MKWFNEYHQRPLTITPPNGCEEVRILTNEEAKELGFPKPDQEGHLEKILVTTTDSFRRVFVVSPWEVETLKVAGLSIDYVNCCFLCWRVN